MSRPISADKSLAAWAGTLIATVIVLSFIIFGMGVAP